MPGGTDEEDDEELQSQQQQHQQVNTITSSSSSSDHRFILNPIRRCKTDSDSLYLRGFDIDAYGGIADEAHGPLDVRGLVGRRFPSLDSYQWQKLKLSEDLRRQEECDAKDNSDQNGIEVPTVTVEMPSPEVLLDSPSSVMRSRMNSAQRRKDFAQSVRQAREQMQSMNRLHNSLRSGSSLSCKCCYNAGSFGSQGSCDSHSCRIDSLDSISPTTSLKLFYLSQSMDYPYGPEFLPHSCSSCSINGSYDYGQHEKRHRHHRKHHSRSSSCSHSRQHRSRHSSQIRSYSGEDRQHSRDASSGSRKSERVRGRPSRNGSSGSRPSREHSREHSRDHSKSSRSSQRSRRSSRNRSVSIDIPDYAVFQHLSSSHNRHRDHHHHSHHCQHHHRDKHHHHHHRRHHKRRSYSNHNQRSNSSSHSHTEKCKSHRSHKKLAQTKSDSNKVSDQNRSHLPLRKTKSVDVRPRTSHRSRQSSVRHERHNEHSPRHYNVQDDLLYCARYVSDLNMPDTSRSRQSSSRSSLGNNPDFLDVPSMQGTLIRDIDHELAESFTSIPQDTPSPTLNLPEVQTSDASMISGSGNSPADVRLDMLHEEEVDRYDDNIRSRAVLQQRRISNEELTEEIEVVVHDTCVAKNKKGEKGDHKHPFHDSAYQSKEQSTDQCNGSHPASTTVSPTLLSNTKPAIQALHITR